MKNLVFLLAKWLAYFALGAACILIVLILKSTVFFSEYLLGNLKFSHHREHEFKLSIHGKTIGYIFYEDGWFIDKQYAYGTLLRQSGSGKSSYFLYDCQNDQYQIIDNEQQFQIQLKTKNLAWKNFRDMNEVEEWSAVKQHKRKFSNICPAIQ